MVWSMLGGVRQEKRRLKVESSRKIFSLVVGEKSSSEFSASCEPYGVVAEARGDQKC
jgi:hypothetical protein